jgi:hypothetical protein
MRARRYALTLEPVLVVIVRESGRSAGAIAQELTRRGIRKPRGGTVWSPADVYKLLRRLTSETRR